MAHVFLLNSTVVFWPERNVLYAKSDETKRITLSNPATRCLLLLIQQQGQVVERDYFFEHVWYTDFFLKPKEPFYFSILRLNSSTWQFYTSRSPSVFCQR